MRNEAYFHLKGMLSQQNCRYWVIENPRELHERPLPHSSKGMVWCALRKAVVIGLYFFENKYENAVIVNSDCYTKINNNFFVHKLQ